MNRDQTHGNGRREFLRWAGRCALGVGLTPSLSWMLAGCESIDQITAAGANIAQSAGFIDQAQAESIVQSGRAVARSVEDITPEQEYYIGRTVGAVILKRYPAYTDKQANRYVNVLGQVLARASDLPETYGGYHFLIMNSDDINALSAPGGFIFVTRGLLRCCRHEDAAAAVLAHEIGHVQHRHGLQAIKKSRITTALTTIGVEGAKSFGSAELSKLTETFEQSVSDITRTLIDSGYSRAFEYQADAAAATILRRVGYNPTGLVDMLTVMDQRLKPGRLDFAKTHPDPKKRIAEVRSAIRSSGPVTPPASRQSRFQAALGRV
ncbi:MAG: M48 family metalloprotease [Thermodesulfobacteriota bacterium]